MATQTKGDKETMVLDRDGYRLSMYDVYCIVRTHTCVWAHSVSTGIVIQLNDAKKAVWFSNCW